ncbi:MAG TPA: hypothetical protein VKZ59_12995 [Acidobacteriota bacterium]|nr:hypothetical protein [Acidobacteriota bacterium]
MKIQREWTPHEADEWTREDYLAMIFSSLSYLFLTIGAGLCFLLPLWGFLTVGIGLLCALIMYWIIDPKLQTLSIEYESKQKEYLKELDRLMKWKEE